MSAPNFWRQINIWTILLYPFSLLYGGLVVFRYWYYKYIAWQPTKLKRLCAQHQAKILVIGNLTVGGVGKTPLVAYLAQFFKTHGYRVAIVTRGYRGHATHYPYVVDQTSTPAIAGDEACMLFKITGLTVVVDPCRARAVTYLLKLGYQLIVSDDGLQHYRMPRHGELVVLDAEYQFGNRLLLPAGPLREPIVPRFQTVNWLVVNCNCNLNHHWTRVLRDLKLPVLNTPTYAMRVVPLYLVNLATNNLMRSIKQLRGIQAVAVAAIGRPAKFFKTLEMLGVIIIKRFSYPDHYDFKKKDYALWGNHLVIMTSKDAIKITNPASNFWYLATSLELMPQLKRQLLNWARN